MKYNAKNNPTPALGYDTLNDDYNVIEVNSDGLQFNAGFHWNTVSLAWEANTGGAAPGGDVNVTNFPAVISGASVPVTGTFSVAAANYALKVYFDGSIIYVCQAAPGSALNAAVWQIQKFDTSSDISGIFADGNDDFDNTATNLAIVQGHSYS